MSVTTTAPAHGKQFTLYSHELGPNPWKVAMILEELGLSYHTTFVDFSLVKSAPYTDICPNGRLPALVDHNNNDLAIWESGAIILYLVGKYDPEEKMGFKNFEDNMKAVQWLMFQMSGQGPYYGQAVHFLTYHEKKVDSAINRYLDETRRVLSVLEKELTDGNKEWLVGGRVSYADISFVVWNKVADVQFKSLAGWREEYPRVAEWDRKMNEMPSVAKCIAEWSSFVEVALKKRGM